MIFRSAPPPLLPGGEAKSASAGVNALQSRVAELQRNVTSLRQKLRDSEDMNKQLGSAGAVLGRVLVKLVKHLFSHLILVKQNLYPKRITQVILDIH